MAARNRYRDAKSKREPGGFVALPHVVLRSPKFAALSSHAVKLMVDILSQYNGMNNGDINLAWSTMEARGWRSRDTLAKARDELIGGAWIAQTRQGGRHAPSLYGLTFYALDASPKFDISTREFPRGAWDRPLHTAAVRRNGDTPGGSLNAPIDTPGVSPQLILARIDTPGVSVERVTALFVTRPAGCFLESPSIRADSDVTGSPNRPVSQGAS